MKKKNKKKTKPARTVKKRAGRGVVPQQPNPADESVASWRRSFALRRRQAGRERIRQSAEQERLQIFLRKTRNASGKKAPKTLRTRAFYRFSRVYPGTVDADGFRENAPDPARIRRQKIFGAVACVLAFCLAFVVTRALRYVSAQTPENAAPEVTAAAYEPELRILRIPRETLAAGDADAILRLLEQNDCNAALFEIKDEDGRLLVRPGGDLFPDTDRLIPGSEDVLASLKDAGVTLCGYISCYRDSAAASANPGMAVLRAGDGGVWTDNAGKGWLNPFSAAAADYLLRTAAAAVEYGMDILVLDHVSFSGDSGSTQAYFPGENDGNATRNSTLTSFVNAVVKNAGDARVVLMAPAAAFDAAAQTDSPGWGGSLWGTGAGAVCTDARPSRQKPNLTIGGETFRDAASLPYPFVLAAGDFTAANAEIANADVKRYVCIEGGASLAAQMDAVVQLRADGVLIW